jgi:hypothetical protein
MVHDNQPVNNRQLCHQHLKNKLLNNHLGLLHNKQIGLLSNRQDQLLSNQQGQLLSNQPDRVQSQLPNLHNGLSNKSKKQSNLPDKLLHHNRNHNRPQKNLVPSLLNGHLLSNQLNVSNLVGSSQVNPALKLKLLFRPMEQVRLQFKLIEDLRNKNSLPKRVVSSKPDKGRKEPDLNKSNNNNHQEKTAKNNTKVVKNLAENLKNKEVDNNSSLHAEVNNSLHEGDNNSNSLHEVDNSNSNSKKEVEVKNRQVELVNHSRDLRSSQEAELVRKNRAKMRNSSNTVEGFKELENSNSSKVIVALSKKRQGHLSNNHNQPEPLNSNSKHPEPLNNSHKHLEVHNSLEPKNNPEKRTSRPVNRNPLSKTLLTLFSMTRTFQNLARLAAMFQFSWQIRSQISLMQIQSKGQT